MSERNETIATRLTERPGRRHRADHAQQTEPARGRDARQMPEAVAAIRGGAARIG